MIHFVVGKAITALSSFFILFIVVRELPPGEYAYYPVFIGAVLLTRSLTSLGYNNAAFRFIPELVIKHAWDKVYSLVLGLFVTRTLILFVFLLIVYMLRRFVLSYIEVDAICFNYSILTTFLIAQYYFAVTILESLQQQKISKWFNIFLSIFRLTILAFQVHFYKAIGLNHVILMELISHSIIIVPIYALMFRLLAENKDQRGPYSEPIVERLIPFCGYNYLMLVLIMASSRAADKIIAVGFLKPITLATFGFCESLTNQLQMYMPTFLLRSLIQPSLMASYAKDNDSKALMYKVSFLLKINLFTSFPLFPIAYLYGNELTAWISNGVYDQTSEILLCLLVLLVLWSQSQMIELMINATEQNKELFISSVIGCLFIAPAFFCLHRYGILGLLAMRVIESIAKNVYLIIRLKQVGFEYTVNIGYLYLVITTIICTFVMKILDLSTHSSVELLLAVLTCISVFYGIALLLRPFEDKEREYINRTFGRKVFLW